MCQEHVSCTVTHALLYLGEWQSTVELTCLLATHIQLLPACERRSPGFEVGDLCCAICAA